MPAVETAEAILLVIKRLAKWIAAATIVVAAIGLVIWGAFEMHNYFVYERPRSQIKVTVNTDMKFCGEDFPFFVGVVNKSNKTIVRYSFYFQVTEKGRSTDIAHPNVNNDDKIIKPTEGFGNCWRIKHKDSSFNQERWITDKTLEVKVVNFHPTFE